MSPRMHRLEDQWAESREVVMHRLDSAAVGTFLQSWLWSALGLARGHDMFSPTS